MKVVILAGGFGTRISEESAFKPKPMIEIGEDGYHFLYWKYDGQEFDFNTIISSDIILYPE